MLDANPIAGAKYEPLNLKLAQGGLLPAESLAGGDCSLDISPSSCSSGEDSTHTHVRLRTPEMELAGGVFMICRST